MTKRKPTTVTLKKALGAIRAEVLAPGSEAHKISAPHLSAQAWVRLVKRTLGTTVRVPAVAPVVECEHEVHEYVQGGRNTHSMGQICLRCGRQWDDATTSPYVPARKQRRSDKQWLKEAK